MPCASSRAPDRAAACGTPPRRRRRQPAASAIPAVTIVARVIGLARSRRSPRPQVARFRRFDPHIRRAADIHESSPAGIGRSPPFAASPRRHLRRFPCSAARVPVSCRTSPCWCWASRRARASSDINTPARNRWESNRKCRQRRRRPGAAGRRATRDVRRRRDDGARRNDRGRRLDGDRQRAAAGRRAAPARRAPLAARQERAAAPPAPRDAVGRPGPRDAARRGGHRGRRRRGGPRRRDAGTTGTRRHDRQRGHDRHGRRPTLIWPNDMSKANSDDWLVQNHDKIAQLRPTRAGDRPRATPPNATTLIERHIDRARERDQLPQVQGHRRAARGRVPAGEGRASGNGSPSTTPTWNSQAFADTTSRSRIPPIRPART